MSKNGMPYHLLLIALLLLTIAAAPPTERRRLAGSLAKEQRSIGAEEQRSIAAQESAFTPTPPLPLSPSPPLPISPPLPTPDEIGAIIVIVQPGDSMWAIAARAGISLPELLAFNNLTENSIITPGDALIVGYATPEFTAPEEITPTATLPPPTPRLTATPALAAVCLSAFDDGNRNGIHDEGESLRAGVAFTIYNTQAVVANYITDGRSEPKCLGGLPPGEYRITRSLVPGEILTTEGDWTLTLTAGSELRQAFGSFIDDPDSQQPAGPTVPPAPAAQTPPPLPSTPPPTSPPLPLSMLGVAALFLGGLLLLGAVLILLIRQSRNPSTTEPAADHSERRFRNIDDLE